jgi:hypothetical protein
VCWKRDRLHAPQSESSSSSIQPSRLVTLTALTSMSMTLCAMRPVLVGSSASTLTQYRRGNSLTTRRTPRLPCPRR